MRCQRDAAGEKANAILSVELIEKGIKVVYLESSAVLVTHVQEG